jgi:hypothetical protein
MLNQCRRGDEPSLALTIQSISEGVDGWMDGMDGWMMTRTSVLTAGRAPDVATSVAGAELPRES